MHSKTVTIILAILCSMAVSLTPTASYAWWANKSEKAAPQEAAAQDMSVSETAEVEIEEGIEEDASEAETMPADTIEGVPPETDQDMLSYDEDMAISETEPETVEDQTVEQKINIYYTIKKGDTLWDLSEKFFDSPWVWPDLWSQNGQILNPHLIYPGDRIHIVMENNIISITKVPPEEPIEEGAQVVEDASDIDITIEEPDIEPPKEATYHQFSTIDHVGFIRKTPAKHHGTIFKNKGALSMISKGDTVYISKAEDAPPLIAGSLYTVFTTLKDPIRNKKEKIVYGIQHKIQGVVEITEIQPEYAVAKVVKNYREMHVKDKIIPYKRLSPDIEIKESAPGIKGKFICAEEHNQLFGEGTIAFIDKGIKDGVEPGQTYSIYYDEKLGSANREVDFGSLFVLRAEEGTSTVVINETELNVEPGTKIKTPVE